MKSNDDLDLLDLELDVPTTPEDVAALRRARQASRVDLDTYLRFLEALDPTPEPVLRSRRGPRGNQFFEL